jgi:putative ABC transport system permease protein
MEDVLEDNAAQPRFTAFLLGGLSATALLLALVGIYGIIAYTVTERTQEMGIRIALGADRGNIFGLVLRQAILTSGAGVALGLIAAFALTRLMSSLLYRVSVTDPLTFIAAPLLFVAIAALAGYLPALRATRVNPVIALR